MSIAQRLVIFATNSLLLIALAGLLVRRRAALCLTFTVYLAAVIALTAPIGFWPDRFWVWTFFMGKELALNLFKLMVALELTVRVFQAFPLARKAAGRAFVIVFLVTMVAVLFAPSQAPLGAGPEAKAMTLMLALQPRISNGTAWLFGTLFALILYYRLPLHPLHKSIAFGFMAYLLLLTLVLDQAKRSDFAHAAGSYANSLGYAVLAAYWAWAAWRPDETPPVEGAVVDRLQPWRRP